MNAKFWWEDFGKKAPERPRRSSEDNIKINPNKIGWQEDVDWINPYQGGNVVVCKLLDQSNYQIIIKALVHEVCYVARYLVGWLVSY